MKRLSLLQKLICWEKKFSIFYWLVAYQNGQGRCDWKRKEIWICIRTRKGVLKYKNTDWWFFTKVSINFCKEFECCSPFRKFVGKIDNIFERIWRDCLPLALPLLVTCWKKEDQSYWTKYFVKLVREKIVIDKICLNFTKEGPSCFSKISDTNYQKRSPYFYSSYLMKSASRRMMNASVEILWKVLLIPKFSVSSEF